MAREHITLACSACQERNYISKKDKRKHGERLELKKFCWRCKVHTAHREVK